MEGVRTPLLYELRTTLLLHLIVARSERILYLRMEVIRIHCFLLEIDDSTLATGSVIRF